LTGSTKVEVHPAYEDLFRLQLLEVSELLIVLKEAVDLRAVFK